MHASEMQSYCTEAKSSDSEVSSGCLVTPRPRHETTLMNHLRSVPSLRDRIHRCDCIELKWRWHDSLSEHT
jgi:hypothetical protein